jgi:hypothetical protein
MFQVNDVVRIKKVRVSPPARPFVGTLMRILSIEELEYNENTDKFENPYILKSKLGTLRSYEDRLELIKRF